MLKDILYEKVEQRLVEKELNPDKARRLAEWTNADHSGSLRNDTETLFLSEQGDVLPRVRGGMNAGFHDLPGVESWFGGRYVRTISVEEAYAWCLETGNTDVVQDHFPFFSSSR
jgi:hypothetical protein